MSIFSGIIDLLKYLSDEEERKKLWELCKKVWKRLAPWLHKWDWVLFLLVLVATIVTLTFFRRVPRSAVVVPIVCCVFTLILGVFHWVFCRKNWGWLDRFWKCRWLIFGVMFFAVGLFSLLISLPHKYRKQIVFVVDLDEQEIMEFRDILDDLEPKLRAKIILLDVDSNRHIARLHNMTAEPGQMKWDLVAVDNNLLGILEQRKLVQELSELSTYDQLIPDDLLHGIRRLLGFENKSRREKFYFAPFRANVKIAYYNKTQFTDDLKPPKNWDDLLKVANEFKRKEGVGRVAIQGYPGKACAVTVYEFIMAAGGREKLLDPNEKSPSRRAFEMMKDLKPYLLPEHTEVTFDTANELLICDEVYLVNNWTYGIKVVMQDAQKEEIGVYSGWRGDKKEFHVLGGDVLAIPKGAPDPNLAIKLIELLLSRKIQEKLISRLCWPSVRDGVYDYDKAHPYFDHVREALQQAGHRPTGPEWPLIEEVLSDAYKGLVLAGEDVNCLRKYSERLKKIPSEITCHPVDHDDDLKKISVDYNISKDDLAKLNGITIQTPITPAHTLLVPVKKAD